MNLIRVIAEARAEHPIGLDIRNKICVMKKARHV